MTKDAAVIIVSSCTRYPSQKPYLKVLPMGDEAIWLLPEGLASSDGQRVQEKTCQLASLVID